MRDYDFVAIGGGNAGLTAVARIAGAGHRTALIDRGPIGGLCSLNGCNPKKVLVRSTELLDEIRRAAKFGIEVAEPRIDWSRVIDRKESFTNGVTDASVASLKEQGIDLIQGSPRFVAPDEVAVEGQRVRAKSFVIATGSTPRPLEVEGREFIKTSNDILALRDVPADLVIIGAGVVAMEFGQVFARAGSRVKIITPGKHVLSGEDEDIVAALVEYSKGLGIEFSFQARLKAVRRQGDSLSVEFQAEGRDQTARADFVLNAAGRVASIADLDLEKAEVGTDRRGVVVNEFLRSQSNPQIFAAGDAHGRMQLSPVASYEGRVVARNFLENDAERVRHDSIPRAVYTVPPLASVGLTEEDARKRGFDIKVTNNDMAGWKVYQIIGEDVARSKIITEARSGVILGAHMYGQSAGDIINIFGVAMKFGILADDLKNFVYAYPTLSSALPYVFG
jgi:glutathione reductase (NADPH)